MTSKTRTTPLPENPKPLAKSFSTEKGSVYTYDDARKTTRFKTATNEQFTRQDLTVFVDLDLDEEQEVNHAYHHVRAEYKEAKVYVLERQPDDSSKILRSNRSQ